MDVDFVFGNLKLSPNVVYHIKITDTMSSTHAEGSERIRVIRQSSMIQPTFWSEHVGVVPPYGMPVDTVHWYETHATRCQGVIFWKQIKEYVNKLWAKDNNFHIFKILY